MALVNDLPTTMQDRTAVLLRAALTRAERMGEEALRPLGITGREYGVLALLEHSEGDQLNQRNLGAALGLDRTTTMKLMTALEQRGLVRREADHHDRRSYRLEVTTPGRRLARRATQILSACDDAFVDGRINDNEVALLQSMLQRLSNTSTAIETPGTKVTRSTDDEPDPTHAT